MAADRTISGENVGTLSSQLW